MPLSAEVVYNELNGEEGKEILVQRVSDLLSAIPEFRRLISLNRVRMRIDIELEVWGRTPPTVSVKDEFMVLARNPLAEDEGEEIHAGYSAGSEIYANPSVPGGLHPDQIREDHALPIMVPTRGPFGHQDEMIVRQPAQPVPPAQLSKPNRVEATPEVEKGSGIRYASFVTQDYGPARSRTGNESPVIGEIKNSGGGGGGGEVAAPNFQQVRNPSYTDRYVDGDVNKQ